MASRYQAALQASNACEQPSNSHLPASSHHRQVIVSLNPQDEKFRYCSHPPIVAKEDGFALGDGRAPNVYDLFYPSTVGIDASTYSDPCATATPSASLAACARTGVTAAQYGRISDCPASQCSALTGGNLNLKPEEADTWTWGVNLTPSFLPGFSASVDYWDIQVDNYITTLTGPQILNGCLGGAGSLCSLIHRTANGVIFGTQGYVAETNVNFGLLHDRGFDFDVGYKKSLADFGIADAGTWDTELSLNWRYFSGVKLDSNSSQPTLNNGSYDAVDAKIEPYSYFDVSGSWTYLEKYTVRLGVNNIFDKDPPVLSQNYGGPPAGSNTFAGVYDTLGRIVFANFNARF